MVKNNGGAYAQKGFNYQNYIISLVAIRNYKKEKFTIFVESNEDFEVLCNDDYHAYIQVKGQKVSLTKLLKQTQNKPSIIEKNLTSGEENSVYKIVVYDFNEDDIDAMIECRNDEEELFENSWRLNEAQKSTVKDKIGEHFKKRLDNFSIVNSGFKNNSYDARKYLKGEMSDQGISVDNRGDSILNELKTLIELKSEKIIQSEEDKQLKKITADDLNPILLKVSAKDRFVKELQKFGFTSFKEEKIKNEELKIIVDYMFVKKQIIDMLKSDENRLENDSITSIVPTMLGIDELKQLEENTKYAIIISAYCDILEGIVNE